ncbi:hypothetical protein IV417_12210 [Alphaproteobacteria bacterium KMM 3653]|uniref:Uncharacterized protein n=1 Tax=Harenicola maris TaxID=2841044 RepID=A0AAP2G4P4_9RHOB|nr:hypothetical protein [Harenicola maris]
MFARYKTPPAFAQINALAQKLKQLAALKQVFLSYSHNDGLYRLTCLAQGAGNTAQAKPVFAYRGYSAAEITDRLTREIDLLTLETREAQVRKAPKGLFPKQTTERRDEALINELVRQVNL